MTRVLLVDDEPLVLGMQKELLLRADQDWEIVCVPGGEEALAELGKEMFDIVVSDMRMPGMDGAELLAHVRDRWPGTVRIIQSGHCEHDASLRAISVAHQFFPKPLSPGVFREALLRLCALRGALNNPRLQELVGSTRALPSAPRLYLELTRCLSEDHATVEEVAAIVKQDVAMCTKTLQLVRSAYFGFSRDTTSIEEAVTILGFSLIKSLVLVVGVFDIEWPAGQLVQFSLEGEQLHALSVARATRVITAGTSNSEDALIAGMLHDVGKLVLASSWPDEYERLLEMVDAEALQLHEVEERELGVTHADVGAYLLGIWGMHYSVVEAVAHHHSPSLGETRMLDVGGAVHLADAMVRDGATTDDVAEERPSAMDMAYVDALGLGKQVAMWREEVIGGGGT